MLADRTNPSTEEVELSPPIRTRTIAVLTIDFDSTVTTGVDMSSRFCVGSLSVRLAPFEKPTALKCAGSLPNDTIALRAEPTLS